MSSNLPDVTHVCMNPELEPATHPALELMLLTIAPQRLPLSRKTPNLTPEN